MAAVKAIFTPTGGSPVTLGDNTASRGDTEKWLEAVRPAGVSQAVEVVPNTAGGARGVYARGNRSTSLELQLVWRGTAPDKDVLSLANSIAGQGSLVITYADSSTGTLAGAVYMGFSFEDTLEQLVRFTLTFVGQTWT